MTTTRRRPRSTHEIYRGAHGGWVAACRLCDYRTRETTNPLSHDTAVKIEDHVRTVHHVEPVETP